MLLPVMPGDSGHALSARIGGNTVQDWIIAFLLFCCVLLVLQLYANLAFRSLQRIAVRTKSTVDDVLLDVLRRMRLATYATVAAFTASQYVTLPPVARKGLNGLFGIVVVYWCIQLAQRLIMRLMERMWMRRGESIEQMPQTFPLLMKVSLWSLGILLVLSNVGVNVTSLLAGLGIGGVAIALAMQNILGDLFSSFSIYFDKPFRVGDYIVIGQHQGTVKSIGWKTTRLQTLQGEELVISNQELTTSRVQNFKRMKRRRVEFTFRADLSTPSATARRLPRIAADIVASVGKVTLERSHLKEVGETALVYQVAYQLENEEYMVFMDTQQEINLRLIEAFEKEGVRPGIPARRVHLNERTPDGLLNEQQGRPSGTP